MKTSDDAFYQIRLPKKDRDFFKMLCHMDGTKASVEIRKFIKQYNLKSSASKGKYGMGLENPFEKK